MIQHGKKALRHHLTCSVRSTRTSCRALLRRIHAWRYMLSTTSTPCMFTHSVMPGVPLCLRTSSLLFEIQSELAFHSHMCEPSVLTLLLSVRLTQTEKKGCRVSRVWCYFLSKVRYVSWSHIQKMCLWAIMCDQTWFMNISAVQVSGSQRETWLRKLSYFNMLGAIFVFQQLKVQFVRYGHNFSLKRYKTLSNGMCRNNSVDIMSKTSMYAEIWS